MSEIIVYTADYCPYCRSAKALLDKKGLDYKEIDVTNDSELRDKLVTMTNGRTTVPQIFIDGKSIGGFTDLQKLDALGEFDKLLSH